MSKWDCIHWGKSIDDSSWFLFPEAGNQRQHIVLDDKAHEKCKILIIKGKHTQKEICDFIKDFKNLRFLKIPAFNGECDEIIKMASKIRVKNLSIDATNIIAVVGEPVKFERLTFINARNVTIDLENYDIVSYCGPNIHNQEFQNTLEELNLHFWTTDIPCIDNLTNLTHLTLPVYSKLDAIIKNNPKLKYAPLIQINYKIKQNFIKHF